MELGKIEITITEDAKNAIEKLADIVERVERLESRLWPKKPQKGDTHDA